MLYDFKFGGPIEPILFYNREKETRFLFEKLRQVKKGVHHNYALIGPRRIGKSSLLYLLKKKLAENGIVPVFIDCEGRQIADQAELTLEILLEIWGHAVLDAYFEHAHVSGRIKIKLSDFVAGTKDRVIAALSETLGTMTSLQLNVIRDYLQFRIEFEKLYQKEKPAAAELVKLFEDTLSLPEKIAKENNTYFVILLDEFQYTANFSKPINFLSAFRRHMQAQKRVAYIFTGSNIGMMEKILSSKPFGGHIPIEWLSTFEYKTAQNFLKQRFHQLKRKITQKNINELVDFTQGHPAYLNWFGEQCCKEVPKNRSIALSVIKELEIKIFAQDGLGHVFDKELEKVSPKKGKLFQTFIAMNAYNLTSPSEIAKHVPRSTPTEIITYLKRLEERGFVKRQKKGVYAIVDEMLKNYIIKKHGSDHP